MTTPSPAAVKIQDYDGLFAVLRSRHLALAQAQQIESLDEMGKERLRLSALGPVLQALGVQLLMVENPATMELYRHRHKPRDEKAVRMLRIPSIIAPHLFTREKALACNNIRSQKVSPSVRSSIARKAARARWRKARVRQVNV